MALTFISELSSDGSFADVWLANDDNLNRQVAVKILREAVVDISDALGHAKALAKVNHPNIVTVHHYSQKITHPSTGEETDAVIMELVEGTTLSKLLSKNCEITKETASRIGEGIIAGISELHSKKMGHGDFHDENILVNDTDVKIIDILYKKNLSIITTTKKSMRQESDLLHLKYHLTSILDAIPNSASAVPLFNKLLATGEGLDKYQSAFQESLDSGLAEETEAEIDAMIQVLTDEHFPDTPEYATAVTETINPAIYGTVLLKIVELNNCEKGIAKLAKEIWSSCNPTQRQEVMKSLADAIDTTVPSGPFASHLRFLNRTGQSGWDLLRRTTKIRLEESILAGLASGRHDIHGHRFLLNAKSGSLGFWTKIFWNRMSNLDRVAQTMIVALESDWYTQNYVANHFIKILPLIAKETNTKSAFIKGYAQAIRNNARVAKNQLSSLPDEWVSKINQLNTELAEED